MSSAGRTPPSGRRFLFGGLIPLLVALTFVGCASSPDAADVPDTPDVFEQNRRQAVKDSQTPEAQAYQREFIPAIGQDLANLLKKCTAEFPAVEAGSFELVFRIDHWGEPKAVLVNPVTDVTTCVATGFWYFKFPHPHERFAETGMALILPISIK